MQLVIEIPNEDIDVIKKLREQGYASRHEIAILNGIPLPKNHGRIIAELTEEDIAKTVGGQNDFAECIRDAVRTTFANAPTIIEAEAPKKRKGTPLEENDSGYNCEDWIP